MVQRRQVLKRSAALALGALGGQAPWAQAADLPAMQAHEAAPGCWYVQGLSEMGSPANQNFISNAGFVVTSQGVVVIDALGSPALAERLLAEIRKVTAQPVTHVIVTHYHADHIYGLQVFEALGARIIAQRSGREYLFSDTARLRLQASRTELAPWINARTELVEASDWIDGALDLTVADTLLRIQPVGPAHTIDDQVVFVPARKVLYAGDLVFRNRIPFVGDADSRNWIRSLDKLLTFGAAVVVPGHGEISMEAAKDMQLTRDYLVYLRKTMGAAAHEMTPFDEAYQATDWSAWEKLPLFGPANRMNAYNTYLLMEHQDE